MPRGKKKLGLALSGGGAKGAFQVGVLDFLVEDKGLDFHVIGGVSTGALQAAMVAQGDVKKLKQVWESLRSEDDIYHGRFGILGGLLGADSLYNNDPLLKKIQQHIEPGKIRKSGRKLRIGVVSLQTGKYRLIRESTANLQKWILASTAIPVAFEPVAMKGEQYVDGGIRDITPLGAVLNERPNACLVVLASPRGIQKTRKHCPNLFKIGLRGLEIMVDEIFDNDLQNVEWVNELLGAWESAERTIRFTGNRRLKQSLKGLQKILRDYRFVPTFTIAPGRILLDTLDFDPGKIKNAIQEGRKQARRAWPELQERLGL